MYCTPRNVHTNPQPEHTAGLEAQGTQLRLKLNSTRAKCISATQMYQNAQAEVNANISTLASTKAVLAAELKPITDKMNEKISVIMQKVGALKKTQGTDVRAQLRSMIRSRERDNRVKYNSLVAKLNEERKRLAILVGKANDKRASYLAWDKDAVVDACPLDPFCDIPRMVPIDSNKILLDIMSIDDTDPTKGGAVFTAKTRVIKTEPTEAKASKPKIPATEATKNKAAEPEIAMAAKPELTKETKEAKASKPKLTTATNEAKASKPKFATANKEANEARGAKGAKEANTGKTGATNSGATGASSVTTNVTASKSSKKKRQGGRTKPMRKATKRMRNSIDQ